MADPVRATKLDPSNAFDPNTDFLMAVKGDAFGARSGPYLIPGVSVTVGSAVTGGDGTGGGTTPPPSGGITKVFGRTGPEISAQISDYDASQIDYDPTTSGLAADNVQTAIDAVAALRETLPVPGSDGDILTATGGEWSSQPPAVESVFGRSGAVDVAAGDYHTDQIAVVKTVGGDPNTPCTNQFVTAAQIAKLTALDTALQLPSPAAATLGHVLTVVDSGGTKVAAYAAPPAGGGGGGGLSQIDLFPHFVPDASAPPSWVYANGVWAWHFANSGTQPLVAAIDYWPGGTATINLTWSCSVTTGNVQFFYTLTAITPDSSDLIDKAGSASQATGASAAADNAKKSKRYTATISGLDSVAAGDLVLIKLWRNNGAAGNAAGTAVLRGCTLRFS